MDAFDKYEVKGRSKALEALKQLEMKGWFIEEPRPEAKTRYDFIAHKDGKKILIEAKDRYYRYGAFPD